MRRLLFALLVVAACGSRPAPAPAAAAGTTRATVQLAPLRALDDAHGADFVATFDGARAKTRILAAFSTT